MAEAEQVIESGSEVLMHFSIRLEDGTIADSTGEDEPFRFVIGDGSVVQGLELALLGLKAGDRQTLQIGPETAFGHSDAEAIQTLPRSDFPEDMELQPGLIIGFTTPAGEEVLGAVTAIDGDDITVDFNHPLAGHEITFAVEILEVGVPVNQGQEEKQ